MKNSYIYIYKTTETCYSLEWSTRRIEQIQDSGASHFGVVFGLEPDLAISHSSLSEKRSGESKKKQEHGKLRTEEQWEEAFESGSSGSSLSLSIFLLSVNVVINFGNSEVLMVSR